MGFGVWGLGFGVWGLGFGVWGLGFGVWGLGFRKFATRWVQLRTTRTSPRRENLRENLRWESLQPGDITPGL